MSSGPTTTMASVHEITQLQRQRDAIEAFRYGFICDATEDSIRIGNVILCGKAEGKQLFEAVYGGVMHGINAEIEAIDATFKAWGVEPNQYVPEER